jgi:GTPase SAR1 family protein
MAHGIKLLVCGFESSGKSTTTSKIDKALVVNFDRKEYAYKVPHTNITEFTGIPAIIETVMSKAAKYKEKYNELPKTIVLDTVTQLNSAIQKYNLNKFTGFDVHTNNNKDTLALNDFIENTLIANGINVVIVAHTNYDENTARYVIPSTGAFAKAGSFLSIVNESVFIEKKNGKLVVHHRNLKLPCRTTIESYPDKEPIEDYDINKHINYLENNKVEAEEFSLD